MANHTELNTLFLLLIQTGWKVFKIKSIVSLIIHLVKKVDSFLHLCIFSERLILRGLQEVFSQKVVTYLYESHDNLSNTFLG